MIHQFRGKRYRIIRKRLRDMYGTCSGPFVKNKQIALHKPMSDDKLMEIAIHEGLHACMWDTDEEAIAETAQDLARFLKKLGFERTRDVEI